MNRGYVIVDTEGQFDILFEFPKRKLKREQVFEFPLSTTLKEFLVFLKNNKDIFNTKIAALNLTNNQ